MGCLQATNQNLRALGVPGLLADIHIEVPSVDYEELSGDRVGKHLHLFGLVFNLHMISRQEAFPAIVQQIVSATLIS